MPLSTWPWVIGAGTALAGGLWALRPARNSLAQRAEVQPLRHVALLALALALLGAAVGLGWRAWDARAWPGASPADALALLAGGGLVLTAWLALGDHLCGRCAARQAVLGLALLAAAALLGMAAALAPAWPTVPPATPTRTWLFGLRNILAGVGLGGWLPALAASVVWYGQALARRIPAQPREEEIALRGARAPLPPRLVAEAIKPAEDPGRIVALFSFPWLTAACLVGGAWNLVAHAAIGRAAAADGWLLTAWLLGAAYLHITSGWRPLHLRGWLAPLIGAGVLAAGVLAAGAAGSLR